ncbi:MULTISPECIES: thiamine phosphate synthase [unclassified Nitratiruptor]|uniref:thiamine phosphate synthase n=1 Tax=unclassified Nitratiruptor TaxID=2624044 RepID=UPI001915703A|nr:MULTISPECIES: thiamine phosphate synthase [unclassified Nitratiruptor]BCD60081.1 thiamine-phosphate pyrophosphorylase [Nitratiruptor sp. YY08-10]BCD64430.1 thiamine-phosphate pyrophosphorylase [Nitratiruptor sp. YY08-14]
MFPNDLYALCDRSLLKRFEIDLDGFLSIAQRFGAKIIQYRNKSGEIEEKKRDIRYLRKRWDGILIVNDELALASLCDGVHIGQEDLHNVLDSFGIHSKNEAVTIIKKLYGAKMVGLSTHTLQEIQEANELDLEYVGLGAYRSSITKDVQYVLGERLSEIALQSKHKVVAIGGIRLFEPIENVWLRAIGSDLLIKGLTFA